MFNVIELQDKLKNFSQDQLANEMQSPSGSVPQYLVLSEFNRRKRVKNDYQQQQNAAQQDTTVAEEVLAGAGVPQGGLASLARNMAPKTDMMQNTGAMPEQIMPMPQAPLPMAEAMPEDVMGMAGGGYVKRMQIGGTPSPSIPDSPQMLGEGDYRVGSGRATMVGGQFVEILDDGTVVDARTGMPVDARTSNQALLKMLPDLATDTSAFEEFEGTPSIYRPEAGVPSQEDLDLGFISDARNEAVGIGTVLDSMDTPPSSVDFDATVAPPMSIPALPSSVPSLDVVMGSPDNLSAIGGLETIQSAPEAFTMDTAAANLESMVGPDDAIEQVRASQVTSGLDPVAQAREDEINSLLAVFDDPNRTEAEVKAARQRLEQIGAKDRAIGAATETLEGAAETIKGIGQAAKNRIASDAADIYGTLGTGANILGLTDTAASLFQAESDAEAKVTPSEPEPEPETVVSNIPEGIGLNLPSTATPNTPTAPTTTDSSTLGAPITQLEEGQLTFDQPVENQPATPVTPVTRGGSGAGARGAATSAESEILNMLKEREERASSDKWLALAKAGMALMSSKNPTLLGALGEAGNVGLEALNKTRDDYEAAKFDLLTMQQKMAAARARGSSGKGNAGLIDDIRARLANLYADARSYRKIETDALGNAVLRDLTPEGLTSQIVLLENQLNYLMGGSPATTQFDATTPIANAADSSYSLGTPVE